MANENDRTLLERLLAQRDIKAAELAKLDNAIETIQAALGEEGPSSMGTRESSGAPAVTDRQRADFQRAGGAPLAIRPDQFFGMSQTEATDAYLRMVGHAVHIKQILEAIKRGGVHVGGADPQTTLYRGLVRGTRKFVLVSPQTFGLIEFYPNRAKKEKREPKKRKAKRKKKVEGGEGGGGG